MTETLKKITQKSFFVFSILAFFVLISAQALMVKLSLHKLTTGADAIIVGEVKDIRCEWSLDRQIILSIAAVQIQEVLKGDFYNNKIFIQHPGGTVGDISLKVSDMPTFQTDEKVLVFLKSITDMADPKNSLVVTLNFLPAFRVFGGAQGKYFIDTDGMAQKSGYSLIAKEDKQLRSLTLAELKTMIKKILKQESKKRDKIHEKDKH